MKVFQRLCIGTNAREHFRKQQRKSDGEVRRRQFCRHQTAGCVRALPAFVLLFVSLAAAADETVVVNAERRRQIEQALPVQASVRPAKPRRLLIYTRNDYDGHDPAIASACEAFSLMSKKTGAFEISISDEPSVFERESLKQYDAVFLNNTLGNTCKDPQLRQNLLEFVTGGGGLMGVHGSVIAFTRDLWPAKEDWPEFGHVIGARGYAHPNANEHIWIKADEADHPLNRTFGGQGFEMTSEFFRHGEPYSRQRVRVLLSIDTDNTDLSHLKPGDPSLREDHDYALAWVKNYGRGRIFYTSIGHGPEIFQNPGMLKFYLDAAQFVLGDLNAPTTPSAKLSPAVRAWEKLGWRLGIEAYTFHKYTFFETIEKTAELGLPYIGGLSFMQRVSKDVPKDFNQHLSDDELRQIRLKMDEGGVRLLTYYAQDIPGDEAGCRKLFEFGRKMGFETFMCEPRLEQLDLLDKLANEYGINVAIHNHGQNISPLYWRPEDVLKACQGRSKRIGAAPDLGYWMRSGIDPVEGLRILKDRLLTLQMHDLHESGPNGHDVPWGTGVGKSEELFREMHRLGIKPTMIGLEYSHDWFESMPKIAKCIEFFNTTTLKLAAETPNLPIPAASAETVKDADGNVYHTVKIGNQVWTVENLRTTRFNDGTPIPNVTDDAGWKSLATPGFCYYENNPEHGKKYGALYNWYAASSDKIAPKGWRVPTHDEQMALRDYLIVNGYNYDGTTEGNKVAKSMAAKTDWIYKATNEGGGPVSDVGTAGNHPETNNRSGFSALPAGSRWNDGSFHAIGTSVYWWSTTPDTHSIKAHMSSVHTWYAKYGNNQHHKRSGFCIRLIQDPDNKEGKKDESGLSTRVNTGTMNLPAISINDIRNGLVAYWPLDSLSTTTPDLSGNRNHLQAINLTSADVVSGKRGNAVSFNGANTLLLCYAANGSGLPAYSHPASTVTMWVKGNTSNETGRVFSETTNSYSPLAAISTDRRAPEGVVDVYLRADDNNTLITHHRTSLAAFDDAWHHIAWVDDHGKARLFVDGVPDTNSCTYTRQPITPSITALGGVMRDDSVRFAFQGLIDEAAVWSRALTEAEICAVMTNGLDRQPNAAHKSAFGDPDKIDVLVVTGGLGIDRDQFFDLFDDCKDIHCVEFPLNDESEVFEDISDWQYDVLLLYNATEKISQKRRDNFVSLLKDKGIGLVVVHHAQAAFQSWLEFHKINGSAFIYYDVEIDGKLWPHSMCKGGNDIPVTVCDKEHPITRGLTDFRALDETYKGRWWADDNHVLLTTDHPVNDKPIAWTRQYGKSSVFNIQLGHDRHTYEVPQYRDLIIRGVRWTAGAPIAADKPRAELRQTSGGIDVFVDGNPFTSYIFQLDPSKPLAAEGVLFTKPVLYPLRTPSGIKVTRGWPFEKIEGESQDHPHHMGLYFTYDIPGNSFWNNSTQPLPVIRQIKAHITNDPQGNPAIQSVMHWIDKNNDALLVERRLTSFIAGLDQNIIDFDIELKAVADTVEFGVTKEGMFAIRLAQWLTEGSGTGAYLSSNGDEKEQGVWGKRAEWVRIQGEHKGATVGIAILNHPASANYPTYWHARGYGCFSANPLGQYAFEKSRKVENPQPFNLILKKGETAPFKYRVILYDGSRTKQQLDNEFRKYAF